VPAGQPAEGAGDGVSRERRESPDRIARASASPDRLAGEGAEAAPSASAAASPGADACARPASPEPAPPRLATAPGVGLLVSLSVLLVLAGALMALAVVRASH
jgi:hypothetical protein